MKSIKLSLTLSLLVIPLTGCLKWNLDNPRVEGVIPDTTEVQVKEVKPDPIVQTAKLESTFNNKVDILWVMDTSDSMHCDQGNIQTNIDKFAQKFLSKQGQLLDFHIGVTTVWDRETYKDADRDCKLGELSPVGGPEAGGCKANAGVKRYVDRETPNLSSVLGKTLKVGTLAYDESKPETSGPNMEELFSPVEAALTGASGDFRRQDAHLAVIFVTDTDDATPDITPVQLAGFLNSMAKPNVTVSTYAVLARWNDILNFLDPTKQTPLREYAGGSNAALKQCPNNFVDPHIRHAGEGPFLMHEFLKLTSGRGMDLNLERSKFGAELGNIGGDIVRKISRKTIRLEKAPNLRYFNEMSVKYGTQTLPHNDVTGWKYDVVNGEHIITIPETVELNYVDGAEITVSYIPAVQ